MKEKNDSNIKIGFAASSGGHYEQMLMLQPLMDKYNSFIVTEETPYNTTIKGKKSYFLKQINRREKTVIFKLIYNFYSSLKIFFKEKPDVIISTGVLVTVPLCLIAKIFRKKLIYIESFAKSTSATKTGKLMYKLADKFYVQWDSMKTVFPNSEFLGGIYWIKFKEICHDFCNVRLSKIPIW